MITVVLFFWRDAMSAWRSEYVYDESFVVRMMYQIDRHMQTAHEFVIVTDTGKFNGTYRGTSTVRVKQIDHKLSMPGMRYQKLMVFRPDAETFFGGQHIFYTDLDMLYFDNIDHLVDRRAPIVLWQNPNSRKNTPYNTSLFYLRAGSRPEVYLSFDLKTSHEIVKKELRSGTDQAWVSRVLHGECVYSSEDGIYSFREDYLKPMQLKRPAVHNDAKAISFHGRLYPGSKIVKEKFPHLYAEYANY